MRRKRLERRPRELRRRHADDNLCAPKRFGRIRSHRNAVIKSKARKKNSVLPLVAHDFRDVLLKRPEMDLVASAAGEADRNGGSPGSAAHHSNAAHAAVVLVFPKRYSVPLRRRAMFWRCFTMTMNGMRNKI